MNASPGTACITFTTQQRRNPEKLYLSAGKDAVTITAIHFDTNVTHLHTDFGTCAVVAADSSPLLCFYAQWAAGCARPRGESELSHSNTLSILLRKNVSFRLSRV